MAWYIVCEYNEVHSQHTKISEGKLSSKVQFVSSYRLHVCLLPFTSVVFDLIMLTIQGGFSLHVLNLN